MRLHLEGETHPCHPFFELSGPLVAVHRQGAHGVDSHNVIVVPDPLVGALLQCTKASLGGPRDSVPVVVSMKFTIASGRDLCDSAAVAIHVAWTPLLRSSDPAFIALPDQTVMIHKAPYYLVFVITFATESWIIGLPVRGILTKLVPF